jgi:hypothetical protein
METFWNGDIDSAISPKGFKSATIIFYLSSCCPPGKEQCLPGSEIQFPVFWAKVLNLTAYFSGQGLLKVCGVDGLTANPTMNQPQRYDFIPLIFHEMLKFYCLLRTDPPAIGTPDASGHIMQNGTVFAVVLKP